MDALVLVAEDDSSVRMMVEMLLEEEGFRTILAADGEEALRLAISELPDMILLDQSMPKLSGRQVLVSLREHEPTQKIPVLVLSGSSWGPKEEWPVTDFLAKPFNPDELVSRIRQALDPVR